MLQAVSERSIRIFRIASIMILSAVALFFVFRSFSWRWQWDTSCMHYIDFLIDHGMRPYRDIIDMNMPGSYMMEGWAIGIVGGGDVGWRLYEFFLLAVLTGAMIVIAKSWDWLAGLFAGVLFLVIHGSEGAQNAVQREEVMTVLLLIAVASVFVALRRNRPWLMFFFGLFICLPISLKPTAAPLGIVLLVLALFELHRRRQAFGRYLLFAIAGMMLASAIIMGYLIRHHAIVPFIEISSNLLPYYAHATKQSLSRMIGWILPRKAMYALVLAALVLSWKNRSWRNWEWQALFVGVCFGASSFVAQRKGFLYHRYPLLAFLLLLMAIEFAIALKKSGWRQKLGLAGFAGFLLLLPGYCLSIYRVSPGTPLADMLVADLQRHGGTQKLQNQVQCMDMVNGCVTALYRLDLVQHTGFISDFMLFGSEGVTPPAVYRDQFLNGIEKNPPKVLVITSANLNAPDTFDKLDRWPEFKQVLNSEYNLEGTRKAVKPDNPDDPYPQAYRLYVLKSQQNASQRQSEGLPSPI